MSKLVRKDVDGFKWLLDINDRGIGRNLYTSNSSGKEFDFSREKIFMNLINKCIKKNMTCLDLGANIGYATMFMSRNSGNDGTVYAIEPDSHNLKILEENLSLNNVENCFVSNCLITDITGEKDFWIAKNPNLNSVDKTKHSIKSKKVSSYTLEDFFIDKKYPNFIKMDVEGHEVSILNSGLNYFTKNRGETFILMETHPHYYNSDNDFKKTLNDYYKIGFKIKYIIGTPTSEILPFKEKGYEPKVQINSDSWVRSLYEDIPQEDAINFTCNLFENVLGGKCVRSIMLYREE